MEDELVSKPGVPKLFLERPHSGLSTVQCDPMSVCVCERVCVNYLNYIIPSIYVFS